MDEEVLFVEINSSTHIEVQQQLIRDYTFIALFLLICICERSRQRNEQAEAAT